MASIRSVTFRDGWAVHLRALYAQATYADHLEGPITAHRNDALIRALMTKSDELFGFGHVPVHLIQPVGTVPGTAPL